MALLAARGHRLQCEAETREALGAEGLTVRFRPCRRPGVPHVSFPSCLETAGGRDLVAGP
jgi:hypothetical protein